jgi:hypothetical protein
VVEAGNREDLLSCSHRVLDAAAHVGVGVETLESNQPASLSVRLGPAPTDQA